MKKPPSPRRRRTASMPSIPVRHQLDHAVPTVIHHPEEKMTDLGRWTHRVLQEPKKISTWALTIAAIALAIVAGWSYAMRGRATSTEVWTKLDTAITPESRVEVAKEYTKAAVSTWALLQAAGQYFEDAMKEMPNNREVAWPNLGKAVALYDQVARQAPKNSFQARIAALGKARSLEARNELSKAIEQYELVAKAWPESPEGEQAKQLALAVKSPEAAAFYKELYAYSPPKMTLPPLSTQKFDFPSTGSATKSALPNFPLELAPPDIQVVKPKSAPTQGKRSTGSSTPDLPADVLSPKR
jgi:hypothetical protein